ncbi:MAG TPA: phosphoenolpyruvate--protein phosphotransferase [Gemmataceae bacterium]|jgi:phosphotransferase system enzyme I (PtsI)|nr:phosphoenolpyruvate--protein phosphotransferase [Gemmataceae bacterium]
MITLRGIPVSPGVAIGPALVLDAEGVRVPQRRVKPAEVAGEVVRLHTALAAAAFDATQTQRDITSRLGAKYGAIFGAHAGLFEDPSFLSDLEGLIRSERFVAEYAVSRAVRDLVRAFEKEGENTFLAWRSADLYDIENRILKHLLGDRREPLRDVKDPSIVLARDLTPSETATLDRNKVFAFATEHGGKTSHTAIMANALELPAVVGLGSFLNDVASGETVIVDGSEGIVILAPDADVEAQFRKARDARLSRSGYWVVERNLPSVTTDGVPIALFGNIEFPDEATACTARGAGGIGLYRTEFLYVGRDTDPSEEEHLRAYQRVIREMGEGRPIVIRTLDLGADKFVGTHGPKEPEKNPSLGVRSIRLCLRDTPLFRKQLRAILRASAFGDVRIMFPMIATIPELRKCIFLLNDVKEDLREAGEKFNPDIPVGTMIEVPSAAIMAAELAREVDFFSIGTNDLIQYTLAADRTNEHVADLYQPGDPAVLRLIKAVVDAARVHETGVNVCGEMSGDPLFTPLLVGLGLRQLSLAPNNLPAVKAVIRRLSVPDAERIAAEAMTLESAHDVANYLRRERKRIHPEAAGGGEE